MSKQAVWNVCTANMNAQWAKRFGQRRLRSFAMMLVMATVGLSSVVTEGFLARAVLAQRGASSEVRSLERVLTVTGTGQQLIPTTLSQVSLGVVVEAATADAAQQQAAQRQTAVIEYLRSQNVEDLETTGISLSPRYDYRNNRQELRGYEARNTVSFRAETERAGAIMDGAVNAGATQISGVSFVAEDAAIETARQQALEAAVADAQQQAKTVLDALGLSEQEIVGIEVRGVSAPPPSPVQANARLAADAAESTPIIGQTQTINGSVTLHIRY